MMVENLLRVALEELSPLGYNQCNDRILTALDVARNKIFPAERRTSEIHNQLTAAYKTATREIVKTILTRELEEEEAYFYLTGLGGTILLPQLTLLLQRTLNRLKSAALPDAKTA